MDNFKSFSEPAGILTAVNTGLIISSTIYFANKNKEIQEEIKKNHEQFSKIKHESPKIAKLIEDVNVLNQKMMDYISANEAKNAKRDRQIAELYKKIRDLSSESDTDEDMEYVIKMASK